MTRVIGAIIVFVGTGFALLTVSGAPDDVAASFHDLVDWKTLHFTPAELSDGTSDDQTDLNHDGIPNLLRYVLGYGPREPIAGLFTVRMIDGQVEVDHPLPEPVLDATCHFETSSDLRHWESPEPVGDTADRSVSSTAFPMAESLFFRLRVERTVEDSDEDQLMDDVELAWFASISHGPEDDPDGDGLSTGEELRIGRSPHRGVIADPALAVQTTGLEVFTPLE